MDKQPEALRLADEFEKQIWNSAYRAAKELRRLHEVNQELVEALENISHMADCSGDLAILDEANSALIKAGEK